METEQRQDVTVYVVRWGEIIKCTGQRNRNRSGFSNIRNERGFRLYDYGTPVFEGFEDARKAAIASLRAGIEQDEHVIKKLEAAITDTQRLIEKVEALQESDV